MLRAEKKERGKGKYASSTENRRRVWENIIWPLILEMNKPYFSLEEYHKKRNEYCKSKNIIPSKTAGGFVSLVVKGLLIKDSNRDVYSIHYKLIPYMRKRLNLQYGHAVRQIATK